MCFNVFVCLFVLGLFGLKEEQVNAVIVFSRFSHTLHCV